MQPETVTIDKIKSKLAEVPEDKLPEIYDFVEFIVDKAKPKQPKKKKIVKLGGIWKRLGFEKIDDLEAEVRKIRDNSHQRFSEKIQKSTSYSAISSNVRTFTQSCNSF